jgi:hypothetical protein
LPMPARPSGVARTPFWKLTAAESPSPDNRVRVERNATEVGDVCSTVTACSVEPTLPV